MASRKLSICEFCSSKFLANDSTVCQKCDDQMALEWERTLKATQKRHRYKCRKCDVSLTPEHRFYCADCYSDLNRLEFNEEFLYEGSYEEEESA